MIQEVPFAIYIKDDNDISLNSLPSSIEIIPHEASIVMDEAIIVNRIYCVNRLWVINKLAYICNKFIIMTTNKDKYEVRYEDEDRISIWTYDKTKFKNGPISVEIVEKNPEPVKKKRK